jgi:hypothetical protein
MNRKLKQVAVRASRASKSLFEGSSSSNSRREAMLRCVHIELKDRLIAFQRSDDEEEEERGEEERPNEEDENEDAVEVERGRLGGATWLLLLLRLHMKRIGF